MQKSKDIANRLREVFLDGKWVANTNYKELLNDLTWEQATHRIGKLNTIAALVYHINYYFVGLLDAFTNNKLEIRDTYSFDLPEITSESEWQGLKSEFLNNAQVFSRCVEAMDDEKLQAPFIEHKYGTNLRNIEAVIEHGYYHLGQVSLLKALIMSADQKRT